MKDALFEKLELPQRGFQAKRQMAADKDALFQKFEVEQPTQEPVDIASIIACREMLDAQPVPARVQYMTEDDDDIQDYKRPWVGLTDDEIDHQAKKDDHGAYFALGALWAGAKLKERNHG